MLSLMSPKGSGELEMPNTCLTNPNPNKLSGNLNPRSNGFEIFRVYLLLFPSLLLLPKGPKNVLFLPQRFSMQIYNIRLSKK